MYVYIYCIYMYIYIYKGGFRGRPDVLFSANPWKIKTLRISFSKLLRYSTPLTAERVMKFDLVIDARIFSSRQTQSASKCFRELQRQRPRRCWRPSSPQLKWVTLPLRHHFRNLLRGVGCWRHSFLYNARERGSCVMMFQRFLNLKYQQTKLSAHCNQRYVRFHMLCEAFEKWCPMCTDARLPKLVNEYWAIPAGFVSKNTICLWK